MKLGALPSVVKKIVIVRKSGGVRTMKVQDDIRKFIASHTDTELSRYEDGRLASVESGSDFRSLIVSV